VRGVWPRKGFSSCKSSFRRHPRGGCYYLLWSCKELVEVTCVTPVRAVVVVVVVGGHRELRERDHHASAAQRERLIRGSSGQGR
jgi:hypothetical protein